LKREASYLLNASLAAGTWTTYRRGVEKFIYFRNEVELKQEWPASEEHILLFISYLSINNFAPSTINTHIASLAFVHNVNKWPNPTEGFLVKKLKEGCRRTNARSDGRLPITPQMLRKLIHILPLICKSGFEVQLFRAAFLLAFFAFLRVGELASTSSNQDLNRLISIDDINILNSSLSLTIRYSKTDQRGLSSKIHIVGSSQPDLCPVGALLSYLQSRPPCRGPLFIHFSGEVLTSYQFSHVLKEGIKHLGLSPQSFSSHSFRIGAATSAAINGLPEETIKRLGRWRSSCYINYIRPGVFTL